MNAGATAPEYKTVASSGATISVSYSAGYINLDLPSSQRIDKQSSITTFTFSSTVANTLTAYPTVFFNNTVDGGYFIQVAHNLGAVPTVVGIVDAVTGEQYIATTFAATASAYNTASGTITTADTMNSIIRLSAAGATSLVSRSLRITLSVI